MDQTKIKVVGVGGGGSNAVNHMISEGFKNIDFILLDIDKSVFETSSAENKTQLKVHSVKDGITNRSLKVGEGLAVESYEKIKFILEEVDIVIIIAGLGGVTGTGVVPTITKIAKEMGIFTIPVVSIPFKYEGRRKKELAKQGIAEMLISGSTIVIPNEQILSMTTEEIDIKASFEFADKIITQVVGSIIKSIISCRERNDGLTLDDLKRVMGCNSIALAGTGRANSASEAVKNAIASPLLNDVSISEAKGILVHFDITPDYSLFCINEAINILTESVNTDTLIMFSVFEDKMLVERKIKVTLIATGFSSDPEAVLENSTNQYENILDFLKNAMEDK